MVIEERAIGTVREQRVVQCSASDARSNTLRDSNDQYDRVLGRDLRQSNPGFPFYVDALRRHARKNLLRRRVIPESGIATVIEPRRVARKPGFGKNDECRSRTRGFLHAIACNREPIGKRRFWFRLNDRDVYGGHDGHYHHSNTLAMRLGSPIAPRRRRCG